MSCPFLSKLPANFLTTYATLLRPYSAKCPVMSTGAFRSYSSSDFPGPFHRSGESRPASRTWTQGTWTPGLQDGQKGDASQCPFLETVKPTITAVEDEETTSHEREDVRGPVSDLAARKYFAYNEFFKEQILRKKRDHSYRVFKKVARSAIQPPYAQNFASSDQDITVWCSNDYLGMTAHPKVRQAVV